MESAAKIRPDRIYKIFRASEWTSLLASGRFDGSPDDLRDGFVHLSTGDQLSGTLARHFAGEQALIAAELRLDGDPALRWELSRGGARFPHLYRPIRMEDISGNFVISGDEPHAS